MKVYLAVAVKSFQRSLAYRAANLAGIATNIFFGAVYVYVFIALFRGRGQVGGLDLRDTITYASLSQSLLMVMTAFGNRDLSEAVVKGDIATDLSRPVDFYFFWAAQDLGRAIYYLLFRGLPTFAACLLLFRPELPPTRAAGAFCLGMLLLGTAVSFAFRFIISSLAFWFSDVRGLNYLSGTLTLFFSGFIVPLNFLPAGVRSIVELLPFEALAHLPINIYLGKVSGPALIQAAALEIGWLIVMIIAGRGVLNRMVGRLTVAGG